MRSSDSQAAQHPALDTLALYSSGDLPLLTRWQIGRHVRRCTECEHQVFLFRSARAELKREASSETLTGFEAIADWKRLEAEMLGNIGVGVAAGRCIAKARRPRVLITRVALAAGMAALFVAAWMTHIPPEQNQHLASSLRRLFRLERTPAGDTVVRTTRDGIAVYTRGATLTILHPPSAVVSLSGSSAVAARYVDEQTGQVTITKVYGQ
jgi:hypothetical protein